MATATTNALSAQPQPSTPPNSEFSRGHNRARSVSAGEESSPNTFVFPRKTPSPSGTHFTRPRSGTTDAITLLAEIGVLPPPGTAAAARLRSPPTPYYPNRQRPQSMLALPTPPLPPVTLAPAPAGRAKRGTSDLPGNEQSTPAPGMPKETSTDEELAVSKPPHSAGPPPGYQRRGHAHRRSGAISSSDVWNLLSQSAPSLPLQNGVPTPKSIQPPTTPEIKPQVSNSNLQKPNHVPRQSWSAPVSPAVGAIAVSPSSPTHLDLDKKASKVAFTERVEIIPGPHSPASTVHASSVGEFGSPLIRTPVTPATPATPTTPATPATSGRPRSNTRNRSSSISSSQSPLSPELQAQFAHITQRPSTAGAILSPPITPLPIPTEPVPALRIDIVPTVQVSIPTEIESPKSPSKLTAQEKPEKKARKKSHKKALSDGSPQTSSPSSPNLFDKSSGNDDESGPKAKKGGKRKKKKQLKNFLFGKGKHGKDGKIGRPLKRSPTPPSRHNSFRRQTEMELPPAWTESYVMMPEGYMAGRSLEELSSTMSPRYPGSGSDRDSPIIDLDAAMGPFNSPVVGSGMRSSGGFSAAKRRMHSSGAGGKMSIVSGVINNSFAGTHRRSESMPEMGMPLFDLTEHASMEMEDVFEEDEEDEESSSGSDTSSETDESEDGDAPRRMSTGGLGIGIQVTDGNGVTTWEEGISVDWNNVPRGPRRCSLAPTLGSDSSLRNASIQEEEEPEDIPPTAFLPPTIFSQNNDSQKSHSSSPCSTPISSVPSAQSSTSTVTPTSAVSTAASTIPPSTPANSCLSESLSMALPSPPFAGPRTASPGSRRNSLTLKELVDLSLQESCSFDPYADPELRILGEPGPEMRMSVSVDDVPSLTSSSSTMTSSYATYCSSGMQQPSTPKGEEIPVTVVGSEGAQHLDAKGKPKGLKKKWSKVFKFWESDEKKEEKDTKEKDTKEKDEKVHKKEEKAHKKEEKVQKAKKEKKEKVKDGKQKTREKI